MSDPVSHPSHYTSHPSGIECIEVVRHMSFPLGSAVKYIWRVDDKGDDIENLRKAIQNIEFEIETRLRAREAAEVDADEDGSWTDIDDLKPYQDAINDSIATLAAATQTPPALVDWRDPEPRKPMWLNHEQGEIPGPPFEKAGRQRYAQRIAEMLEEAFGSDRR